MITWKKIAVYGVIALLVFFAGEWWLAREAKSQLLFDQGVLSQKVESLDKVIADATKTIKLQIVEVNQALQRATDAEANSWKSDEQAKKNAKDRDELKVAYTKLVDCPSRLSNALAQLVLADETIASLQQEVAYVRAENKDLYKAIDDYKVIIGKYDGLVKGWQDKTMTLENLNRDLSRQLAWQKTVKVGSELINVAAVVVAGYFLLKK
jgi:tetratricopeptide (TPR) repeat protein